MPKTKLEAKAWLKEVGFDDATIETLAAQFTAAQMEKIAEGYMRQSDYDRNFNELNTAKAELQTANERLNAEMAEWATMQADGGKITQKMRQDLEAAQAESLRLTQAVRRIATDAGLDADKVLKEVQPVTPSATTTPAGTTTPATIDLSLYPKTADVNAVLASVTKMAIQLPATLAKLGREHRTLTNEDIDEQRVIDEFQARATHNQKNPNAPKSLDIRAIWEEIYEIPAKRAAAEEARVNKLVAEAEARGRENAISESAIPGQATAPGRHAPVFAQGERKSVLNRPQPGSGVQSAVAALRSGKYRQSAQSTQK